jgi:hypothetical protein
MVPFQVALAFGTYIVGIVYRLAEFQIEQVFLKGGLFRKDIL